MAGDTIFIDGVEFSADKKILIKFPKNSDLTEYVIPDGVTEIGKEAFASNSRLRSETIPEGITRIGEYAFFFCSGLESIVLPDSVNQIAKGAFAYAGVDRLFRKRDRNHR